MPAHCARIAVASGGGGGRIRYSPKAMTTPEDRIRLLIERSEAERRALAQALHGGVGQDLTAALLGLQYFADGVPAEEIPGLAGSLRTALEQVRAISHRLRPPLLDEIGLVPAIASMLERVPAAVRIDGGADHLAGWQAISLFRLAQALAEALPAGADAVLELAQDAEGVRLIARSQPLPEAWRGEMAEVAALLGGAVEATPDAIALRLPRG